MITSNGGKNGGKKASDVRRFQPMGVFWIYDIRFTSGWVHGNQNRWAKLLEHGLDWTCLDSGHFSMILD
jgi:hypothetical protein